MPTLEEFLAQNPSIIAILQEMVSPAQAPFSPVGSALFSDTASPKSLAELYMQSQGDQPTGYSSADNPDLSHLGALSALNLRNAFIAQLAQGYFTGKITARYVQDFSHMLEQQYPESFPLQFTREVLRVIGHQRRLDPTQKGNVFLDPVPIPEAFPEKGQPVLAPLG